ncbi:MAG: hypothetical protein DRP13_00040 [Candidatus Aenigmatarchaeota archaeon]|nr:MAG: hypothetical protein DRP13_00040 [Candidatus Aenigmarchaeota archaeon]
MKRILVTGAGGPAGVNFVRSLRKAEEKMFIAGSDVNKFHLELPGLDKRYLLPKNTDPEYIEKVNEVINREGIEFLHPQPDSEVGVISENREKIHAKVFLPAKETIRICQDKLESAKVWKSKGIPVANVLEVKDENDLEKAKEVLGMPFWLRATRGAGARGSTLVENLETGTHWIKYWESRRVGWKFIAQEYLPADDIAFQSLWNKGELICSQARVRLEYIYPELAPSGKTGTPSVAKTIHDEKVNKAAYECVKAIDPKATGIFCVDLKKNPEGIPCPTEINVGRFFTTSYFFTYAGINMPYLYVKLAYGEEIPDVKKFNCVPEGLYWIRHMDSGPVLRKEGEWRSEKI